MLFLIDAQLPSALARQLAELGHEASHVGDLGLADAKDALIWERAVRGQYTLITKDADFAQRKATTGLGPAVVWIRVPNTRRRALLEWFPTVLPDILAALDRGETLVEIVGAPSV